MKGGVINLELRKINKKGQIVNTVSATVVGLVILIFIIFAVLFGVATLDPSSFFTAGSGEANATEDLQSNLTTGVSNFGQRIPTVLTILGVVFALAGILLLVAYVVRMRSVGGREGL